MNLRGIVSVSGKPGLWKALAQNKNGFILESLDAQKTKLVVNLSTAKIAALDEITIFGEDQDIKLGEVLERMKKVKNVPDPKADGKQLRELFREVAPDYNEEKVYASDMKKIVSWYHIMKDMSLFSETVSEPTPVEETISEPAPIKSAKKPKAAKESSPAKPTEETVAPQKAKAKKK